MNCTEGNHYEIRLYHVCVLEKQPLGFLVAILSVENVLSMTQMAPAAK